jgi:anhydro-N-acetylmuramic acid kinase
MPEIQKVIGLMSGTSLDGIDAALLETDGVNLVRPGEALTLPYDPETRAMLHDALLAAQAGDGTSVPLAVRDAEQPLTYAHAVAVKALLSQTGLKPADVSLIGFHGQTMLHRPAQRLTWQIGDGGMLARMTGIDVVNDFRSADVAAGGQGAPLVPLYHAALVRAANLAGPVVVANVGGVANITYIDGDMILAFDTGPGNAPLDDWMMRHTGAPIDEDGATALRGQVDQARLQGMLANDYFHRTPPKSLDRQDFGTSIVEGLSLEDGAATLTAFAAAALAKAQDHFPNAAKTWIICGGGRHNAALMTFLRDDLGTDVISADRLGWRGDFIEAEAFAYLAARSKAGLPLSLPTTTGVKAPLTGGKLHKK